MIIGFIREEFRAHVVWGPNKCAGHIILVLQHSCNAKVPDFDYVGFCQEDILCFEVPVKNILLVQVLKNIITNLTFPVSFFHKEINVIVLL